MVGKTNRTGFASIVANRMQSDTRYLAAQIVKSVSIMNFRSMCAESIMRNYMQTAPSGLRLKIKSSDNIFSLSMKLS